MWILLQMLACLIVVGINSIYRQYGLTWATWLLSLLFVLPAQFFYGRSFEQAPTFFSAWFLGSAVLAVSGFLVSLLLFDGIVNTKCYIGLALTIVGAYLLIA